MSSKSRRGPKAKPPAPAVFVLPEAERVTVRSLAGALADAKAGCISEVRTFVGADGAITDPEIWDGFMLKVMRLHQGRVMPLHAAYEAVVKAAGERSGLDMARSWTFALGTFTFTEKTEVDQ